MTPAALLALPDDVRIADVERTRGDGSGASCSHHVLAQSPSPPARRDETALMPPPFRDALLRHRRAGACTTTAISHAGRRGRGLPVETGALARMCAHPLVMDCDRVFGHTAATRIVARMAEIAMLLRELGGEVAPAEDHPPVQSIALGAGAGLGVVETARGLLLHRARGPRRMRGSPIRSWPRPSGISIRRARWCGA